MKTYKHLYESMLSPEMVAKCALDAADGKIRRKEVISAFVHFDKTYDYVIDCANNPDYVPCEDNTHEIIDGANHKSREIEKPKFVPEQILHHMIVEPFKPVLMEGLYEQTYGCLPPTIKEGKDGKRYVKKYGPHAAIRQLVKWAQIGKKVYIAEADVKHAYGSVHIPTLVGQLRRVVKDKEWIRLTCQFLHYKEKDPGSAEMYGLILGHYTSPWFFNFYLKAFDHFAAKLQGVKYLRFADNFYLVGTNKRKIHRALNAMRKYLKEKLRLTLNGSTQIYRFEYGTGKFDKKGKEITQGRQINALGAVIHFNRETLRKSILMRMRRKAIRIGRKGTGTTWHDGSSMLARLAWVKCTDTHKYYEDHIKPLIHNKRLKAKVRLHSKAIQQIIKDRRRIIYAGLEASSRLARSYADRIRHDDQRGCCLPETQHQENQVQRRGRKGT